jgi:diguanylate cyclase (GGDEF)-like protein
MSPVETAMRETHEQPTAVPLAPEDAARAVRAADERAARATRRAQALERLLEIGIAVMSEPNLPDLLERILREARRFTNAEAGTLFLREDNTLRFAVAQNDVLARRFGDQGVVQRLRAEPLSLEIPSLAGYVAQTGSLLNIPDAYQIPDSRPYSFQPWWDARNEYQTRSVLAVPLADPSGHVIGVLQLINALDAEDQPVPFDKEWELLVQTLAAHAAAAIANLRLSDLSFKDPLTNVYNRRYFSLRLDEEIKRCARSGQPLAVVGIDVDHFKQVNDGNGHAVGDAVLATVAHLLTRNSRDFTVIARLGGDEFAALLVNTPKAGARVYAERIRRAVEAHAFPHGPLSISLGVASLPGDVQTADAMSADALMQAADRALYQAKEAGRNRVGSL